jgi:hypothetical protein
VIWQRIDSGYADGQARQQGDAGFAAFLGAVQQVVEGADPARVSVELEEPFAEAWRRLCQRIGWSADR